jgi:DNA/RNA-binding domain of Phe-tRNA-synthetase-like protein
MRVIITREVADRFPDLRVLTTSLEGVRVQERSEPLEAFKEEIYREVRRRYTLEGLKDEPRLRAYRDFFWRIGIDPTKIRPAAEALIRRILGGRPLPTINTLVDAYNLASVTSRIALALFDLDRLVGSDLVMRFAVAGEVFQGIGMKEPMALKGGEVVLADGDRLTAIYPYRDADYSKVTLATSRVLMVVCGVPGVGWEALEEGRQVAVEYVTRFCGGREL